MFNAAVVIGRTVGLVNSVRRAPDLEAEGCRFEYCIGHSATLFPLFTLMVTR